MSFKLSIIDEKGEVAKDKKGRKLYIKSQLKSEFVKILAEGNNIHPFFIVGKEGVDYSNGETMYDIYEFEETGLKKLNCCGITKFVEGVAICHTGEDSGFTYVKENGDVIKPDTGYGLGIIYRATAFHNGKALVDIAFGDDYFAYEMDIDGHTEPHLLKLS